MKNNMPHRLFIDNFLGIKILVFTFLFTSLLQAQFTKSVEITSYYDDNLYRTPESASDLLTDLNLTLSYRPEESNFNLYYKGSSFFYQENTLRNFFTHSAGCDYFKPFGEDSKHNFILGSYWNIRLNGDDYNYYDYNQLFAYADLRFDLDWFFLKGGYNFRYRSYTNLPDLTNYRNFIFIQANKSFETKTTLILEADLGYKSFAGVESITGDGSGSGSGRMTNSTTTSIYEIPSLNQTVLLARVTQSLHETIGIYLQYRRQFSLTEKTDFTNSDDYYQDEEIFDDPFSYESESYSTQLTLILPWTMKLQVGGTAISKNYISEQAYTSLEDTLGLGGNRIDDHSNYYVSFSKTFFLNKNWIKSLRLNLDYSYILNESNSYWYNYKNALIGGGLQWNF